ncbi:MAG: ATP F0F1 synthase subunit B, partial [Candidatus Marinimicrobia bacterium]|nr:ATP F0F1 synthase subunit B [Candidatus Neomarinimicrobiota bacterium]
DDAEKAKVELERLSEESEAIMAKARSEAQSILAEGKTAAEKVKDDIIAKSKEQANKIREDAGNQIQVEKEKAIAEIKGEVVNLTLSVAEKLIQKNLSDADNKSLIEASLKKVKPYEA